MIMCIERDRVASILLMQAWDAIHLAQAMVS